MTAQAAAVVPPSGRGWPGWRVVLAVLVLAFAFLGSRGLWDPDEGRYTNVALIMLDSGDWVTPHRNDDVAHWTKPPLTYWAIASSMAVFGPNPWAARLPSALSFLICVWLVWALARRLYGDDGEDPALIYATMLMTAGASQIITTDFLLTACETLAATAFVFSRFGPAGRNANAWIVAMWAAFGLGFLTKGPPALLPVLALVAFSVLVPRADGVRRWPAHLLGLAAFLAVALPWYLVVVHRTPGLLQYFTGQEVVNRFGSNEFKRNGQWYGWLLVYGGALLLGSLPWSLDVLRLARRLPERIRFWSDAAVRRSDASTFLLALWLLLPLVVFCIARSRLPLYILPLFVPLALLAWRQRVQDGRRMPGMWALLVLVLVLKLVIAWLPSKQNAEPLAERIRQHAAPVPIDRLVFMDDTPRYALHLYLGLPVRIERTVMEPTPQPQFSPDFDESAAEELAESAGDPKTLWITNQKHWPTVQRWLAGQHYVGTQLGAPFSEYERQPWARAVTNDEPRIVFRVVRAAPSAPANGDPLQGY